LESNLQSGKMSGKSGQSGSGLPGDPIEFESDEKESPISEAERVSLANLCQLEAARAKRERDVLVRASDARKQRDTRIAYELDLMRTDAREDAKETEYKCTYKASAGGSDIGSGSATSQSGARVLHQLRYRNCTQEHPFSTHLAAKRKRNPAHREIDWTETTYYGVATLERGPYMDRLDENADECSICLQFFRPDKSIAKTPCGHLFHWRCIEREREERARQAKTALVEVQFKCPNCRTVIVPRSKRT
jgi:hypothetical protein